jgi:hypothetical protein
MLFLSSLSQAIIFILLRPLFDPQPPYPQLLLPFQILHNNDIAMMDERTPLLLGTLRKDGYIPGTEEEKRLVRKIDLHLMPTLWVMYILNYIDRTNVGNAEVAGMDKDLHLDDSKFSWILIVFFVGYLIMEVPCNMVLSRSRPSVFLPTIMVLWGTVSGTSRLHQGRYRGTLTRDSFNGSRSKLPCPAGIPVLLRLHGVRLFPWGCLPYLLLV